MAVISLGLSPVETDSVSSLRARSLRNVGGGRDAEFIRAQVAAALEMERATLRSEHEARMQELMEFNRSLLSAHGSATWRASEDYIEARPFLRDYFCQLYNLMYCTFYAVIAIQSGMVDDTSRSTNEHAMSLGMRAITAIASLLPFAGPVMNVASVIVEQYIKVDHARAARNVIRFLGLANRAESIAYRIAVPLTLAFEADLPLLSKPELGRIRALCASVQMKVLGSEPQNAQQDLAMAHGAIVLGLIMAGKLAMPDVRTCAFLERLKSPLDAAAVSRRIESISTMPTQRQGAAAATSAVPVAPSMPLTLVPVEPVAPTAAAEISVSTQTTSVPTTSVPTASVPAPAALPPMTGPIPTAPAAPAVAAAVAAYGSAGFEDSPMPTLVSPVSSIMPPMVTIATSGAGTGSSLADDADSMVFSLKQVANLLLIAADIRFGGRKGHNLRIPTFACSPKCVNVPKQLRSISQRKDGRVTGQHVRELCNNAGVPECFVDVVHMITTPLSASPSPVGYAPPPKW